MELPSEFRIPIAVSHLSPCPGAPTLTKTSSESHHTEIYLCLCVEMSDTNPWIKNDQIYYFGFYSSNPVKTTIEINKSKENP